MNRGNADVRTSHADLHGIVTSWDCFSAFFFVCLVQFGHVIRSIISLGDG